MALALEYDYALTRENIRAFHHSNNADPGILILRVQPRQCGTSMRMECTCEGPRHAAPIQKRVLPASLARTAASYTSSRFISLVAFTPVSFECLLLWLQ
jgi:hypothetical protein